MKEFNFGVAFAGGGAKGAWQIGAWKALEEKGLRAKAVSGTSVGALNATLYAQGDLEHAEKAWSSIDRTKLLGVDEVIHQLTDFPTFSGWIDTVKGKVGELKGRIPGLDKIDTSKLDKFQDILLKKDGPVKIDLGDLAKQMPLPKNLPIKLPGGEASGNVWITVICFLKQLLEARLAKFQNGGFLSTEGIAKLISENVDLAHGMSWMPIIATAHDKDENKVAYFKLFEGDPGVERATKILQASSAIPWLFKPVEVDGKEYSDGGFDVIYSLTDQQLPSAAYDNAPVRPLAERRSETGIANIILLGLSRDEFVRRPDFGDVRVMPLLPSKSLGGITDGCLDFSPDRVAARMAQGYEDAKKWLDVFADFAADDAKLRQLWDRVATGEEDYLNLNGRMSVAFSQSVKLDQSVADFNRMVMSDDGKGELEVAFEGTTLEKRLEERAVALVDAQTRTETDRVVDALVAEVQTNADELGKFTLDAVSALAPVESRSNELLEQGFFKRFWHSLTGKNAKMSAANTYDLAQAQYAALRLIQKVQHGSLLQFEYASILQSHLNRLMGDVAKVEENANRHFRDVYQSLATVYCKTRRQLNLQAEQLEQLQADVRILNWLSTYKVKSYYGKSLKDYSPALRLVVLTFDFYRVAEGDINPKRHLQFVGALQDAGLRDKLVSVEDILSEAKGARKSVLDFQQEFKKEAEAELSVTSDWVPVLIDKRNAVAGPGFGTPMPTELLADEMFFSLKAMGWRPRRAEESPCKQRLLDCCASLKAVVAENAVQYGSAVYQRINDLEASIRNYAFKIYLVGPFSCGKSSLLNRWLGMDVLSTGIAPETAISTELRYGEEPRMILYPLDSTKPIEELSGVTPQNMDRVKVRANKKELLNVAVYLNHPRLKVYSDLCLVDLPGLSSANPAHEAAINQFITEQGTGIFCVPMADGTVQEESLRFLKKMERFRAEFNLLMTKADEKPESDHDAIIATTRQKIKQTLGISDDDFVSGKVSRESTEDFVCMLDAFQQRKDGYLVARFGAEFQAIAEEAAEPLRRALSAQFRNPKLEEALAKVADTEEQLPKLLDDILSDVRRSVTMAANSVVSKLKMAVQSQRGTYLAMARGGADCSAEVASNMKATIGQEAQSEMMDIVERANRRVGEVFGERLNVSLDGSSANVSASGLTMDAGDGDEPGLGSKLMTGLGSGGAGFWLGNLVLPGLGGLIGTALGTLAGLLFGKRNKLEEQQRQEAEFTAKLNAACDAARPAIADLLNKAVEGYAADLQKALTNKVARLKSQMEQLRAESQSSEAEWSAQQATRKAALEKIEGIVAEATKENN